MSALRPLLRALIIGAVAVGIAAPTTAANADPSLGDIQQQIDRSAIDLEKIIEQFNKVTEQLASTQAEADQLAAQTRPLKSRLDAASDQVSHIATTAYKTGRFTTVGALLSSGSPEVFVHELSSLNQLARVRQREITEYTTLKSDSDAHQVRLDTVLAQQSAQRTELASKKTTIETDLGKLYAMRTKAYGSATASSTGAYTGAVPNVSGQAGVAVRYAYGAIGKPYVFAAAGSDAYDCSGLTMAAWAAAGVRLSHGAVDQYHQTARIPESALQPGDLAFYNGLGHVGIYIGNGQIIHAAQPGTNVAIASVHMMPPDGFGRPA